MGVVVVELLELEVAGAGEKNFCFGDFVILAGAHPEGPGAQRGVYGLSRGVGSS